MSVIMQISVLWGFVLLFLLKNDPVLMRIDGKRRFSVPSSSCFCDKKARMQCGRKELNEYVVDLSSFKFVKLMRPKPRD